MVIAIIGTPTIVGNNRKSTFSERRQDADHETGDRVALDAHSSGGTPLIRLVMPVLLHETGVATVSVPIVAGTCARRGAGFSRFLQLVPGEGESQTTGKLCVLHFF